tara:strand:+ start:623 stop:853 length:231 start_codon:yes stop_codon:yes gene_type:complete
MPNGYKDLSDEIKDLRKEVVTMSVFKLVIGLVFAVIFVVLGWMFAMSGTIGEVGLESKMVQQSLRHMKQDIERWHK